MGYEIAQKVGITMIGRATNKHYLLFTGAERFVVSAEPRAHARSRAKRARAAIAARCDFVARFPSRFVAHCHCESCRRAHGAAFVTWVGLPASQVEVIEGGSTCACTSRRPARSARSARRAAPSCSSRRSAWPGETHVVLAAFDEPVDRAPAGHAFCDEHVAWLPPLAHRRRR